MVRSGKFELHVLVGGVPLPELGPTAAGEVYVETKFHTRVSYSVVVQEADPFGESFTQSWPVTPYTLRIVNNSAENAEAQVFIDGMLAAKHFLSRGENEVKGFKESWARDAACKEFLFTLPRRVRKGENAEPDFTDDEKAALKAQLESIRVEIREATLARTVEQVCDGRAAAAATGGRDAQNKAVCKAAGSSSVSASGREIAGKAAAAGTHTFGIYDVGKMVIAELLVRYSQRQKLENLGLLAPVSADGSIAYAVPRSRKTAPGGSGAAAAAADGAAGGAGGSGDDVKFGAGGPVKKARVEEEEDKVIDLS